MFSVLWALTPSHAETLYVTAGDDLQEAINFANYGDIIEVQPGTYQGPFKVEQKDIEIRSVGGSAVTTLLSIAYPYYPPPVLWLENATVTLEGFTIDGGMIAGGMYVNASTFHGSDLHFLHSPSAEDAHFYFEYSEITLTDSLFEGTVDAAGQHGSLVESVAEFERVSFVKGNSPSVGGAIYISASDITFRQCTFSGNTSQSQGGALFLYNDDHTTLIEDSLFEDNHTLGYGGAIFQSGGELSIVRSTFRDNETLTGSGTVDLTRAALLRFEDGVVENNHTDGYAAGLGAYDVADVVITGSSFSGNSAGTDGGAILIYGDAHTAEIVGNHFCNNTAEIDGGALWFYSYYDLSATINHNVFIGSSAGNNGGVARISSTQASLSQNTIVDTYAGHGAIYVGSYGSATLVNNALVDTAGVAFLVENPYTPSSANYTLLDGNDIDFGSVFNSGATIEQPPAFRLYEPGLCTSDLRPAPGSPLQDAGDPTLLDDDGTRSDIGAYGGPGASSLVDVDGDGVIDGDCAPYDPLAALLSSEIAANGLDEDCDGSDQCYLDADGDGDGAGDITSAPASDPPCSTAGVAPTATDCDDLDPTRAADCTRPPGPDPVIEKEEPLPPGWFCSVQPAHSRSSLWWTPLCLALVFTARRAAHHST